VSKLRVAVSDMRVAVSNFRGTPRYYIVVASEARKESGQ
jgi:hypothetical protein